MGYLVLSRNALRWSRLEMSNTIRYKGRPGSVKYQSWNCTKRAIGADNYWNPRPGALLIRKGETVWLERTYSNHDQKCVSIHLKVQEESITGPWKSVAILPEKYFWRRNWRDKCFVRRVLQRGSKSDPRLSRLWENINKRSEWLVIFEERGVI